MAGRISYYGNIVKDGLVLDLDAAKRDSYPGTGTAWNDISGFRNNGVLINGPTFNSGNGGSIVFDGSNDYVNLGNPTSLNILNFTVCIWSKSSTFTDYQNLIFKGDGGAGQYGIAINSLGQWTVQPNVSFISDTLTLNAWNFLVGTYNGTQITAYRNGEQKTQYSISQTNRGNTITIGGDIVNNRYLNGSISQTLIYNRALSATEVLQNYNATKGRYL